MTLYDLLVSISIDTKEYDTGLDNATGKFTSFGAKVKSGLATTAKVGAAAVAAVGTATVAAGAAITKATGQVAKYGDNIDKMSQKMGVSAEKYQEWDAVLKHSGSSMESMKASMKTLANAAEKGNKSFERIGLTQQEVAKMSQEELFEATISGLQNVESSTERTYLAGQLLGRGATELGALLNTSAEDTQKMKDRVHELGGVMSDDAVKASAKYQDTLQDMQTSIQGLSRNMISEFLPSMSTVMEGITDIFAGGDGQGKITEGINGIIETIGMSAPRVMETVRTIGTQVMEAIGGNLPQITSAITNGVINLASGIVSSIPSFLSATGKILSTIISSIGASAPQLLSSGLSMITSLGQGLTSGIPQLLSYVLSAITGAIAFITSHAGDFISTGLSLIINLGQGILNGIPVIISYIPKIVSGIWGAISSVDWVDLGKKVINGIVNGIKGIASLVPAALKAIAKTAILAFRGIDWKGIGKTVISFIATAARGAGKLVLTALSTIGKLGINAFKKIDWRGVGKTVITFIGNAIRGAGGLLLNALRTAGTKAWQGFKSINWLELGSNIISGIIRGIGGAAGRLFGKLRGLASDALGAAKKVLKIGSPSKLFEQEVGKNIILGWAKGIDENAPLVERAISDVNSDMMDAFAPMGEFPLAQDMEVSASPLDINSDNPMGTRNVNITNYITVDGAKDPEEWTSEFVRTLKLEMRTA